MKRFVLSLLLFVSATLSAQTTKVRGQVTDADTGEGIPFAAVFFKGTTIGQSTDMEGRYSLETRDPEAKVIVCQLLGYDIQEVEVKQGAFTTVNFSLKVTDNLLTGAYVKADNRKARRLLANIDAHRDRNNPECKPGYTCDVYSKMELDLAHAQEQLWSRRFYEEFGFVFDYMDTSTVSGVPYLPVMISESVAKREHTSNPDSDTETIVANQVSGVNPDANLLSQFTGSMHLRVNFYNPFINSFDVEFPSPIQSAGMLYYNYFIIDSLKVDGRKTYLVRFHPKEGISSPALDGEMHIDAQDFAMKSIHAKMKKAGNVNWLRDIAFDTEYERLSDGTWFYKSDKMYADFSITLRDSSKIMSFLGNRELSYSNISFEPREAVASSVGKVNVLKDSNHHDARYWDSVRPYELTEKERNIYGMVDKIQDMPLYKTWYDIVYTAINGYWDIGKIGLGPYHKIISFNNLEGFRPQMGIHTSKDLSKKFRWTGYLAYGFADKQLKGGVSYERLFSKEPQRKLTVDAYYDVFQLGKGHSEYTTGNILSSIFGKGNAQRLAPMSSFSLCYDHEFNINFNARADIALKRYYPNGFVPMVTLGGVPVASLATNELHLMARFSREETVNRGHFVKKYLHTNFPVFTFDLTGSVPGLRKCDCGYLRPEVSLDWKFRIPPAGMSMIHFNAGTIFGKVPYPLLHLHEGNGTYVLDKTAFSCMKFFEFASDSWLTLFWNHNFNGFFFGKIPGLRRLNLREEFTFKATYGWLSDKNNPLLEGASQDMMAFPEGMKTMGNTPYMEIGAGVSNILRLFRVDCIWRLTHLESASQRFAVNLGIEFRF